MTGAGGSMRGRLAPLRAALLMLLANVGLVGVAVRTLAPGRIARREVQVARVGAVVAAAGPQALAVPPARSGL